MFNVLHKLQNRRTSVVIYLVEYKFWTKKGLEKLGSIIRGSRESKGLSLREVSEVVAKRLDSSCPIQAVDHGTLSRVEKGYGEPKFNTLVAIASSKIATCGRGIPLDIYDFIDIASESFGMDSMNVLARLVKAELQSRNWTLGQMAAECGMEFKDLFEISEGRESEDFETDLILLGSVLTNPRTGETFGSAESIMEFCGINSNDHKSA
jgi:transcriptional regulator with XRE-family HTH domain